MLWLRLYRWLRGSVTVVFEGAFAERLLNLCAHRRLSVWNIRRAGERITVQLPAREFRRLHAVRAQSGIAVSIAAKHGLPFFLRRYRRRVGLFAGFVLFFVLLQFLSSFVWSIEVAGNDRVPTEEILAACRAVGITEGMPVRRLDALDQRVEMMLQIDGLAWAALNLEGTRLTVDVTEAAPTPPPEDETPCNLKAARDGVVRRVEVTAGGTTVRVGDAVRAGDLLASGIVELKDGQTELQRASGRILAETQRELRVEIPLQRDETVRTGRKTVRRALRFFHVTLPLYLGAVDPPFERDCRTTRLAWFGARLPIEWTTAEFYETETRRTTLDPGRALIEARAQLEAQKETLQAESVELISETSRAKNGVFEAVWLLRCLENIAIPEKIVIHTTN